MAKQIALIEEVVVRLQRGDPKQFAKDLALFLKDPSVVRASRPVVYGGPYRTLATEVAVEEDSDDLRTVQAKVLWNRGWGREQKIASFEAYLASIPAVPEFPEVWTERFDRTILVDARIGFTKACALAGCLFEGNDLTFVNHESVPELLKVYWLRCQDGRRNLGKKPFDCRANFPKDERGLIAFEGVSLYVQDPVVINDHYLDLPGSVLAGSARGVAHLGLWDGRPSLNWHWDGSANPDYGSASAGVVC